MTRSLPSAPVLAAAPADARDRIAALFALDDALGAVLRTTSQPLIGQMRLTWWHERLEALGEGEPPAEPVLRALAETLGREARGLAAMVDGWEVLLDEPFDMAAVATHGRARGAALGTAIGRALGGDEALAAAVGEAWALADLAGHLSKVEERALVLAHLSRTAAALPRRVRPPLAAMQPMLDAARVDEQRRPAVLTWIINRLALGRGTR